MTALPPTWPGAWVAQRLDVRLETTACPAGVEVADLVGMAVRDNPRRAHLLVSTVLGKHVPTDPRLVLGAGMLLGRFVASVLAGEQPAPPEGVALREALAGAPEASAALLEAVRRGGPVVPGPVTVLGYAETATGLGHAVFDVLGPLVRQGRVGYLHSTRRRVPGIPEVGGFEEEHSHATSHRLVPRDPSLLTGPGALVLVDDELSTGTTALNTIRALHALAPRGRYVVAALVDLREPDDAEAFERAAAELGVRIDVVSLAAGRVRLPADVLERGRRLVEEHRRPAPADPSSRPPLRAARLVVGGGSRGQGGRLGGEAGEVAGLEGPLRETAAAVAAASRLSGRLHVLGSEELMYLPTRLAAALAGTTGREVVLSTTTRSPVLVVDEPGYAVRTGLVFPSHDDPADGPGPRFAYNLTANGGGGPATVVLVVDDAADTPALHAPGGLVDQVRSAAEEVLLVVVPDGSSPEPLRHPAFGSYPREDVAWLLKDLSGIDLEAPTEEREEAIQSGGAHYAESLPIEFQPDAAYQQLFHTALAASADRLAFAVGLVTEQLLRQRGERLVLASLARAGTPVGVLVRRWAAVRHGLDLPHYAVSIVRGRGIDRVALQHLATAHDPREVVFVDGWTGKGAIARELAASVQAANAALGLPPDRGFDPDLAVLADPGRCVSVFGTREDYLVPSACLNATVSGLVSRTVLNADLTGPGELHGAKYYRELADADVSNLFVDTVAERFADVSAAVDAALPGHLAADRTPTWAGWAAVEAISRDQGIGDVNLVKPGVGETTRVLLRRVPWKVLCRVGAGEELAHVRLLAAQRGVPVEEVDDLPYSCVGLIHPRYTRGAVGAAGTSAGAPGSSPGSSSGGGSP